MSSPPLNRQSTVCIADLGQLTQHKYHSSTVCLFPSIILAGADNPTYLKGGTEDYIANIIAGVLISTGVYKISNGLYNMSFGINVLEIQ